MRIIISQQDQTPIYQQIVNQVKLQVSSGRLSPDEELPSIRALAEQLLVNPNTVARAYRELEQAGCGTCVEGRHGWPSRFVWDVKSLHVSAAAKGTQPLEPSPAEDAVTEADEA